MSACVLEYSSEVTMDEDAMTPEEAALKGLLSADEYLDLYGEPRRPWLEVKDCGKYCPLCQIFFARKDNHLRHMRKYHIQVIESNSNPSL